MRKTHLVSLWRRGDTQPWQPAVKTAHAAHLDMNGHRAPQITIVLVAVINVEQWNAVMQLVNGSVLCRCRDDQQKISKRTIIQVCGHLSRHEVTGQLAGHSHSAVSGHDHVDAPSGIASELEARTHPLGSDKKTEVLRSTLMPMLDFIGDSERAMYLGKPQYIARSLSADKDVAASVKVETQPSVFGVTYQLDVEVWWW